MKMKWDDRYCMGIEEFDRDHRQIFQIVERLLERLEDGGINNPKQRVWILNEGRRYIQSYWMRHARSEEAYMRKIGYPHFAEHKRAHDAFSNEHLMKWDFTQNQKECTKEAVFKFLGSEIGWILEHITTMDLAIVGRGYLNNPKVTTLSKEILVEQINLLLTATMNMDFQAKIVDDNYRGGHLNNPLFHLISYKKNDHPLVLVVGMEKDFIIQSAKNIYEGEVNDYEALIIATMDVFGASFWTSLGTQILDFQDGLEFVSSRIQTAHHVRDWFEKNEPHLAYLFSTVMGNFCVLSSNLGNTAGNDSLPHIGLLL